MKSNMFPRLDDANRKWLYRLNVVLKLFKKYWNEVRKQNAYYDFPEKIDNDKTGRNIICFWNI